LVIKDQNFGKCLAKFLANVRQIKDQFFGHDKSKTNFLANLYSRLQRSITNFLAIKDQKIGNQ